MIAGLQRCFALSVLALFSCVSTNSTFGDVRTLVTERAGIDVTWSEVEQRNDETISDVLSRPLDAQAAVKVALLSNRSLQAKLEDLGVARAVLLRDLRPSNPTFHGSIKLAEDVRDLDIALVQSISDIVYSFSRASIARADLEARKLSVSRDVLSFAFATKRVFFAYQAAEQTLEMRRTIAEAARAGYELAKRMHAAGNLNDLDLGIERGLYEDARIQYARAELTLVQAREQLNKKMGLMGAQTAWSAVARLDDPEDEPMEETDIERMTIEKSLELAAIERQMAAANGRIGLARAQGLVPDVAVGIAIEGEVGANAPPLPIGPLLELTIPLWDQGQGEVAARSAELRRLEATYAARAIDLRADARAIRARTESLRQQTLYLKNIILPLRARILQQTQLMNNAMQIGLFQLLMAKRDQIEAGRSYVATLADYWTSRAELDLLLQGGSPTDGDMMSGSGEAAPERRGGGH